MKEKDNGMIDVEVSREAAEATERIRRHIESLPEEKRPKVCIKCITYNHGEFIREALDGFLMQQTDFPFVAIVHDDASTDNTADIVREYAERYPDIIFPIFETENQYRKPGGPLTKIMQDAIDATGARYVAMCEGDDYWTSPHKLQLQADFLDTHPDYVMVTTRYHSYFQSSGKMIEEPRPDYDNYDYTWLAKEGIWPMATLVTMYRAAALNINRYLKYPSRIDAVLFWNLLQAGKGHLLPDFTAIYRIHDGGAWSGLSEDQKWNFDFKFRMGIHNVDKSIESLKLIKNTLRRHNCGRKKVFKSRRSEFTTILKHITKIEGLRCCIGFLLKYIKTGLV